MIEEPLYRCIIISVAIHLISILFVLRIPPVKKNKNLRKKMVMARLINIKPEFKKKLSGTAASSKAARQTQKKKFKKVRKKVPQITIKTIKSGIEKRFRIKKASISENKKTAPIKTKPAKILPGKPVSKILKKKTPPIKTASVQPADPAYLKKERENIFKIRDNTSNKTEDIIDEPIPLETTDRRYSKYFGTIRRKINNIWSYPDEAAMLGLSGTVKLKFILDREGNIKDVIFVTSSGHRILDDEAVYAIKEASPYNAIPKTIKRDTLPIVTTFRYFPVVNSAAGGW